MADRIHLGRGEISAIIPHGEPFLFLDSAVMCDGEASGTYRITGDECFMAGHFPGRPIFPAAILVEALGQLAIAYMLESPKEGSIDPESIYFIKSEDVKCSRKCLPGDVLELKVTQLRVREPLMVFSGDISVSGELAMKVSSFTLSFAIQAGPLV